MIFLQIGIELKAPWKKKIYIYNYFLPMYLLLKEAYVLRQTKYAKPKAKHPGKSVIPNANSA